MAIKAIINISSKGNLCMRKTFSQTQDLIIWKTAIIFLLGLVDLLIITFIILGNNLYPTTKDAIAKSPPSLRAALILGSPEMMKK